MTQQDPLLWSKIFMDGCSFNIFCLLVMISTKNRSQFRTCLSARKVIIKSFNSILDILHDPFNQTFLFLSKKEWIWCFNRRNLQTTGYHVPPSVDTACFPQSLTMLDRIHSASKMFLSLDISDHRPHRYNNWNRILFQTNNPWDSQLAQVVLRHGEHL